MSMIKIKKGDLVKVIAGASNGKEGKVISVDPKNGKVLVEGVNVISKHSKPSVGNPNGGIVQKEAPIDISNVMYVHAGKPTKIGFEIDENGIKRRIAKSTGEVVDADKKKKK